MSSAGDEKQELRLELTLRVAEAFIEDVGRGLARIDQTDLARIGVLPGDIIQINGRRATVARVTTTPSHFSNQNIIQIDGITRDNAQVGIDDRVIIRKIPYKPAESVLLSPVDVTRPIPKETELHHLRQLIAGLPVIIGDKIQVTFFGAHPIYFIIEGVNPRGAVLLSQTTNVAIKPPDISYEKAFRVAYEDIGGLDREVSHVREMIELPLKFPDLFRRLGIEPPKGVLLTGPPGTGKTLIARAVACEVRVHFIHVNGPEIIHKFYGESEAKLREVFEDAKRNAPSIIFLDEIDAIAPKRAQVIGDVEKRVVGQLLALMDGLVARGEVIVIGATNMPELLDPALRRPGRFDREISIGVPNRAGRYKILQIHSRFMPLAKDVDLEKIAEITHGFVGADLAALCKEAGMIALRRILPEVEFDVDSKPAVADEELIVNQVDFMAAYKAVEPTSTREFTAERPRIKLKDIGGLDEIKQTLRSVIEVPMQHAQLFETTQLTSPKGILFYGPSGTGKTATAKAIAGELQMSLITVDPPSLFSKWVGESEKGLREVFKKAKQASPCILFLDEIDSMAPIRGTGAETGGVPQRLVSQLLREMDELQGALGVIVLAATNRIDLIDPALMRAGRFDFLLEFPIPNLGERIEIFRIHTEKLPLGEDVVIDRLAEETEEWAGADIEALCKKTSMIALDEFLRMNDKDKSLAYDEFRIRNEHFKLALMQTKKMPIFTRNPAKNLGRKSSKQKKYKKLQ